MSAMVPAWLVVLLHVAPLGDRLVQHRPVEGERQRHLAALALVLHRGVELAEEADLAFLAEADDVAGCEFLGRPHEGAPARAVETLVSVASIFGSVVAADTPAGEPRRDHAGVVDHQRIAGIEQVRQVADAAILQPRPPGRTTRSRAASRGYSGPQRDALGRQFEIEQIGAHGLRS